MHPLVARIHPALRTAFFAWLISRTALWWAQPIRPVELAGGPPLPGLLDVARNWLTSSTSSPAMAVVADAGPWMVLELAMLAAGVAVYRFVRTTTLPQAAERACWLWFFNPLLALYVLDWGTQMAAAAGAMAVAAIATRRPRTAAVAAIIAVGCRIELIVLWPALAACAWRRHRPQKDHPAALVVSVATIPLAFSAWIGASWHLAGAAGSSLRGLHGDAAWRDLSTALPASMSELVIVIGLVTAAILAIRYLRRCPLWYGVCALVACLWPLLQVPVSFGAITVAWSLPTFVHLATATDDRAVERPLLAGVVIAFIWAATAA